MVEKYLDGYLYVLFYGLMKIKFRPSFYDRRNTWVSPYRAKCLAKLWVKTRNWLAEIKLILN